VRIAASLFSDEEGVIAEAEALLTRGEAFLPLEDFAVLLKHYKKLQRQSAQLVKMGDRMQGKLNVLNCQLTKNEEKYRTIFENSIQGIYRSTPDGRFLDLNPAMARMLGYDSAKEMLRCVNDLAGDACLSRSQRKKFLQTLRREGMLKDYPLQLRRRDGETIWVEVCARGVFDEAGKLLELEGLVADVTEKRRMLKELEDLARRDGLTGLWNRRYFLEQGQREMARARRENTPLSLVFFDVDHFKRINDAYGHEAGDKALVELANLGRGHLRELDIFGRMGGEEFAVLLPGTTADGAMCVAEKIRAALEAKSVITLDSIIRCTASFGIATRDLKNESLDDLLQAADAAMYKAKRNGRNMVWYNELQALNHRIWRCDPKGSTDPGAPKHEKTGSPTQASRGMEEGSLCGNGKAKRTGGHHSPI
jgi:diguanylate cyclase (GGDEF)-like protein/PAS domain S-box-containing protein